MGSREFLILLFRRWPCRALGLPFKADGFAAEDNGVGSH